MLDIITWMDRYHHTYLKAPQSYCYALSYKFDVYEARLEHLSSPEMQLTGAVLQVWPDQTDGRENPVKAEV